MFNQIVHLPDGFLSAAPEDLLQVLQRPTLIHLEGRNPQPLFVSTLLHGNETTGFYALQELLGRYTGQQLPRSLSIFIGNVAAAAVGQRRLSEQVDYNRVWPGTPHAPCEETDIMETVTSVMRAKKPFASIDIHNNTGRNPHYACINVLSAHSLQIAARFSSTIVYFTSPKGVQSLAFAGFCPAVVLECGQSRQTDHIGLVADYLDDMLNLEQIPGEHPQDVHIHHTVARVTVPERFSIAAEAGSDITIDAGLEDRNFTRIDSGSRFAMLAGNAACLEVRNESNEDVTGDFFHREGDALLLRRDVILSMFTSNSRAIKQDCLCYFMERLNLGA